MPVFLFNRAVIYDKAVQIDYVLGFTSWVTYLVFFCTLGALTCKYISVQAIGSGIPEVKVIMNGFTLHNYLTFRTLIAKMLSLTLVLGSGMPLGKEGPFVHMGAIVATLLSKMTRQWQNKAFFSNEGREVEILSSGCAVGIACTFSAPAGAVLYGIESTHKYFAVKNYWRAFFATTCSALIFRFANAAIIPPDIAGTITAYYQTSFPNEVFLIEEIPVFMLIGVLCGLAGAMFLMLHKKITTIKKNSPIFKKLFGTSGFSFTVFMALVVGLITFPDGFGKYIGGRYTFRETISDLISNCTMSLYNTTAMGCQESFLRRWATNGVFESGVLLRTLLGYFLVNYLLVAVCITLAVPAGIFVPSFVLGATGGRVIGELMTIMFPEGIRGPDGPQIYPGLYAVVGAAAYTGAITHSLSIAVIVCETTGQLCALLPVLIALMIANAVSSFLHPSIYESIIIIKRYPHLTELPPSRISVHTLKVEQIMVRDVVYITKKTTYKELRELLINTPQLRSYPLVTDDDEKILLGSVARKYLNYLLNVHLGADPLLSNRPSSRASKKSPREQNGHTMTTKTFSGNTLLSISPLHEDSKCQTTLNSIFRRPNQPLDPFSEIRGSSFMRGIFSSASFRRDQPDLTMTPPNSALRDHAKKLEKPINLDELAIDSAPFQLVLGTSLYKVHTLFSLLSLNHAYVTHRGKLVGVVALRELRLALADIYTRGAVPNRATSMLSMAPSRNVSQTRLEEKGADPSPKSEVTQGDDGGISMDGLIRPSDTDESGPNSPICDA
uniref:Chloride channel protein n=1 Tax=Bursaphelenchus xylophilus TaxID=6326 RepID=A0A1I7RIW9_BURXY